MKTATFPAMLVLALLVAGCGGPAEQQTRTAGEQQARVPDTIVFVFQRQVDPQGMQATADRVARIIEQHIDHPVEVVIPTSYGASVQAVVSGRAHVAYMSAIPFLLTRDEAPFELLLAEERNGATDYSSIIVVREGSDIQALEDLRGKRVMWTSSTSTSGYVMPYSRLVNEGLLAPRQDPASFFASVNYAGGYDRALLSVFSGQSDVCAVSDYTLLGNRADIYSTPEMREGLRILAATSGVPTHAIGIRSDLPREMIDGIREALLAISNDSPELLADVYGAASFVVVDEDEHVAKAVEALDNTGLSARALTR